MTGPLDLLLPFVAGAVVATATWLPGLCRARRAAADAALRGARTDRDRSLLSATREAILVHENRRVVEVNDEFLAMIGNTRDELLATWTRG